MTSGSHAVQPVDNRIPADLDATLWRFMSLEKYLDLLVTQKLFFASLPTMEDAWEGAVGPADNSRDSALAREMVGGDIDYEGALRMVQSMKSNHQDARGRAYVNCWHLSEYESAAMWRLYAEQGKGIAIRSTWRALSDSLRNPEDVYIAKVEYRGQDEYRNPLYPLQLYTSKRESFAHEREVRLIRYDFMDPSRPMTPFEKASMPPTNPNANVDRENIIDPSLRPHFYRFDVDLEALVQSVVVAPECPQWTHKAIQELSNKYEMGLEIERSALEVEPGYL